MVRVAFGTPKGSNQMTCPPLYPARMVSGWAPPIHLGVKKPHDNYPPRRLIIIAKTVCVNGNIDGKPPLVVGHLPTTILT
jgi:hypothetical protein